MEIILQDGSFRTAASLLKAGEKNVILSLKSRGKRKSPHAANPHADWISLSAEGGIRTHAPDTGL